MRMFTEVGRRVLPHCTAVGKAILADLPPGEVRDLLQRTGMPRHTEHTITDPDVFAEQLRWSADHGYAIDDGEQELGVRCVAVAVPGVRTHLALSVSGPAGRMTPEPVERAVPLLAAEGATWPPNSPPEHIAVAAASSPWVVSSTPLPPPPRAVVSPPLIASRAGREERREQSDRRVRANGRRGGSDPDPGRPGLPCRVARPVRRTPRRVARPAPGASRRRCGWPEPMDFLPKRLPTFVPGNGLSHRFRTTWLTGGWRSPAPPAAR